MDEADPEPRGEIGKRKRHGAARRPGAGDQDIDILFGTHACS
jgi:hypothetical protein